MNSILLGTMLLQCINLQIVHVTSLKSSSHQNRRLGPRGASSSSRVSSGVQDANFERRKEHYQKDRQLKCKDQFVNVHETPPEIFMFVDCVPSQTAFPTFSPTTTPVPTKSAFPSVSPHHHCPLLQFHGPCLFDNHYSTIASSSARQTVPKLPHPNMPRQ